MKEEVIEFMNEHPNVYFIKVRDLEFPRDYSTFTYEHLKDKFIPDPDLPKYPDYKEGILLWPLDIKSFPTVLKTCTSMEAGVWAVRMCMRQNWACSYVNACSCLCNLEMDM